MELQQQDEFVDIRRISKLYPSQELRNRLIELGIPRKKHNLAELGEMLPEMIEYKKEKFWLVVKKYEKDWQVFYLNSKEQNLWWTDSHTEADARAKMLIYLKENNLL